jgi:integrase
LRRTKASLIYRRTKNLQAVQLLLGHTKMESTVRYLGIEVDDALEIPSSSPWVRAGWATQAAGWINTPCSHRLRPDGTPLA